MNAINVPVTITPEAAARVDELGMREQLEQMVGHAVQAIPQLVRIDIETYWRADDPSPDGVLIQGTTTIPWQEGVEIGQAIGRWKVRTFPPEVCEHFLITLLYGEEPVRGREFLRLANEALLDAIDTDPARRAAAVASLPP
jgi:hypothetical protein